MLLMHFDSMETEGALSCNLHHMDHWISKYVSTLAQVQCWYFIDEFNLNKEKILMPYTANIGALGMDTSVVEEIVYNYVIIRSVLNTIAGSQFEELSLM